MKHKHCELIKAWADGAEIQYQHRNGAWYCSIDNQPSWDLDVNYRIRPKEKVVRWQWIIEETKYLTSTFYTEEEADAAFFLQPRRKCERTREEFDE